MKVSLISVEIEEENEERIEKLEKFLEDNNFTYFNDEEKRDDEDDDGISGQDRESYSDNQDRESYIVDEEEDDCDCGGCEECVYGKEKFYAMNGVKKDD